MQLVLNAKNVCLGAVVIAAGYYGYRNLYGDIRSKDTAELLRAHRSAQPARQLIIRRRILTIYESQRDYETIVHALGNTSPTTQALAVAILREKGERRAVPRLLDMLEDPDRADIVKEELAATMGEFEFLEAVPRLIELTDTREAQDVRIASHNALKILTGAKGEMKLSDATRQHWTLLWRDHPKRPRH
ncbi:MAG: HEAT repeat domain-containing protein [bacterium]